MTAPDFYVLGENRYCLKAGPLSLDVDRLRRKSDELVGELTCRVFPPDTPGGIVVSTADFNMSSLRARQDRAKHLAERAGGQVNGFDFFGAIESLCQQIIVADRAGHPMVSLRDLPRPEADAIVDVEGWTLLARHPVIAFGDGGAAKSYLALWAAGTLAQRGFRVGIFDWELAGEDHRLRLERLFGVDAMPDVKYLRCDRPLAYGAEAMRRLVREHRLDFVVLDSIAFACDGKPEDADVAGRYFQAVRQLGPIGSLHLAHVTKGENADAKPFGSAFWFNGARSLWNVKLAETGGGDESIVVGLHHRKANLGQLRPAIAFEITFTETRTLITRIDAADVDGMAIRLPVWQRMVALLKRRGPLTYAAIAAELGAKVDAVERATKRGTKLFVTGPDRADGITRVALLDRRTP